MLLGNLFSAKAQLVWADVAPIFYNRCGNCHNQYGHSGISFLTAYETAANAALVDGVLSSGYMPPWMPDTTYTRFAHEKLIGDAERNAILSWISSGALAGDTTLAPPVPTYSQYQLHGTPDKELQIPTFTSNAMSDDSYVCFSLPSGLTSDRYLRAYEIIAGNPGIVHHVIVNVDTTGAVISDLSGTCYTASGQYSIGGYAPGAPATVFPNSSVLKMGIRIRAGSNIILQIHYPMGSAGEVDSTKIRLYFYPPGETGVRPVNVQTPLQNWMMSIPAESVMTYTAKYPSGAATLPSALSIFAAFPHSHKICTKITNYAYQGTDTIPLIKINNWDFNWQGYYTYRNMVKIPSGYKLFGTHTYDNTSSNPFNPSSPPIGVTAGTSTNDEMFFDSFMYLLYQSGDELINIDSLLQLDPLSNGVEEEMPYVNGLRTFAFPNPFAHTVNIGYIIDEPAKVKVYIYSLSGKLVQTIDGQNEVPGAHQVSWDGRSANGTKLSDGNYLYTIVAGNHKVTGKITLVNR